MAIIDAVNRWLSALNDHDIEAIADAIAPGGTYLEPTLESPIDNEATGQHLARFRGLSRRPLGGVDGRRDVRHHCGTPLADDGHVPTERQACCVERYRLLQVRCGQRPSQFRRGYFDVLSALKQTRD